MGTGKYPYNHPRGDCKKCAGVGYHTYPDEQPFSGRRQIEDNWHKEAQKALPMDMLASEWSWLIVTDKYEPNRTFVRELKEISPDLSVRWTERDGRWAIFRDVMAYEHIPFRGGIITYYEKFPMLLDMVQGKKKEFKELGRDWLPMVQWSNINVYRFLMEKRDRRLKQKQAFWLDYHDTMEAVKKDSRNELERVARPLTGNVPDLSMHVLDNVPK